MADRFFTYKNILKSKVGSCKTMLALLIRDFSIDK